MHEREGARLGLRLHLCADRFRPAWACPTTALGEVIAAAEAARLRRPQRHPSVQAERHCPSRPTVAGGRGDRRGQHRGASTTAAGSATTPTAGALPRVSARAWRLPLDSVSCSSAPAAPVRRSRTRCSNSASANWRIVDTRRPRAPNSWRERLAARFGAACDAGDGRRAGARPRADGIVNATPVGMAKYPGLPFARRAAAAAALGGRHRLFPGRRPSCCGWRARAAAAARWPAREWRSTRPSGPSSCSPAWRPIGGDDAPFRGSGMTAERTSRVDESQRALVDMNEPFRAGMARSCNGRPDDRTRNCVRQPTSQTGGSMNLTTTRRALLIGTRPARRCRGTAGLRAGQAEAALLGRVLRPGHPRRDDEDVRRRASRTTSRSSPTTAARCSSRAPSWSRCSAAISRWATSRRRTSPSRFRPGRSSPSAYLFRDADAPARRSSPATSAPR